MQDRLQALPLCINSRIVSAGPDCALELGTSLRESQALCVAAGHTSLTAYSILCISVGQKIGSLKDKDGGKIRDVGRRVYGKIKKDTFHFSLINL